MLGSISHSYAGGSGQHSKESCPPSQAASGKLSLCTVLFLNHLLSRRDFFSLSFLNNDLCSGCTEPVEQLVHVKGTKDEGTLGTRSLSYQWALAVELLRALGDPLGTGAMAPRVLPGLLPPTLLTKPDLSLLPRKS